MSDVELTAGSEESGHVDMWEKDDELGLNADTLGRKADADFLIRFLTQRIEERGEQGHKKSYVLNIDSQWGGGKTFFLKRLGKQLKAENHLVADVNAWEDDHAEDPLIAVMAAIGIAVKEHIQKDAQLVNELQTLNTKVGKVAFAVGAKFLRHQADKYLGEGAADLIGTGLNAVKETENVFENVIENFQKEKQEIHDFRTELEKFLGKLKDVKKPLFILVDEMDRCRPPYAIAMLERAKHLFNIDNVIFIFATDTAQLSHSIKAVYGEGFESVRYLHRFFNQTYKFPQPPIEKFIDNLMEAKPISPVFFRTPEGADKAEFYVGCFRDFNSSLRDIEQCFDILHNVVSSWTNKQVPIQAVVMLPLVIAFHKGLDIHQPWGKGLFREVESCAEMKPEKPQYWKVDLQSGKMGGEDVDMMEASCWDILKSYIELSQIKAGLFRTKRSEVQNHSFWERHIFESIYFEYAHVEGSDSPEKLKLRQYPNIIASAGRLGRV